MSDQSYKPTKMSTLVPYLMVKDPEASVSFYENAFGFTLESAGKDPQTGKVKHAEMRYKDVVIMFGAESDECAEGWLNKSPASSGTVPPLTLYLYHEDTDALYARAVKAGAKSQMEPQDTFWGDRMCKLADSDGFEWAFATYKGNQD